MPKPDFHQLLTEGSDLIATLCRLCEEEKSAIEQQSATRLQVLVDEKENVLEALAANTRARNRYLEEAGLSADAQGMATFLDQAPETGRRALNEAWQTLVSRLEEVSRLNSRNEQIVQRNQKHLQQLLSLLQGQSERTRLYDPSGLKNYQARGSLGKA